ncbi:cell division control protein 4 [Desarmillaria tabescens]|uniref:Cell division control protein 4 n=1 Tax=Armillaria tabescens TaxID=1929756 RepID=A0AA39JPN6_ARMTA|nr:cell division control protein 4 [Desarmillaria tabescens]KAK0444268.1 cell division control protein 4 [Desarmillaria tabescens]
MATGSGLWVQESELQHRCFPAHGSSVVTCLTFSRGRGVWALAATEDTLVSGSTDRTVRIWDLATGRCTHVFGGHSSTVRCLTIVKPEWVDVEQESGSVSKEKWPDRSVIVTGSRDHSLRVWTLPKPGEDEYHCYGSEDADPDTEDEVCDAEKNPYHRLHLEGHDEAIRALAAWGRTVVSGSYDYSVRVWDIVTGQCKFVLTGHTGKVYSVVMDPARNQAYSSSMDGMVRVWNLHTGQCQRTLVGHTSLVGLLGISPSYLVSGAADATLRVWDPDTGELKRTFSAHAGAITCFQHDEFKVFSGSDSALKLWNIGDGTIVREFKLSTGVMDTLLWKVMFDDRWCVAASKRNGTTLLDVWDFGSPDDDGIEVPPKGT